MIEIEGRDNAGESIYVPSPVLPVWSWLNAVSNKDTPNSFSQYDNTHNVPRTTFVTPPNSVNSKSLHTRGGQSLKRNYSSASK